MSAGIIGSKRRRPGRQRNALPQQLRCPNPTPVNVVSVTQATTVVTVTFDQVVMRNGVPRYTLGGLVPVSAATVSPTSVALTYASSPLVTSVVVPFEDAAVRNATGGYVDAGTYTIAASEGGEIAMSIGAEPARKAA